MLCTTFLSFWILGSLVGRSYQDTTSLEQVWSQREFPIGKLVQSLNYPFESFEIETQDGYLITLHRIPYGRSKKVVKSRQPVLLMHGLLGSSENFLYIARKSLAFMLVDAGFDVWMPNARGNMHSRKHKTLNPNKNKKFWEFSWNEIGIYDLTSSIDFILNKTGFENLQYLGHSQGCTSFFVMQSDRPEYNKKVKKFVALAPAVYMSNFAGPTLKELLTVGTNVYDTLKMMNQSEFVAFLSNEDLRNFGGILAARYPDIYIQLWQFLLGQKDNVNVKYVPLIAQTFPAGSSLDQIAHYVQTYFFKSFRHFDYGREKNMKVYNNTIPPLYNFNNMNVPTYIFAGQSDTFASLKDVNNLTEDLPNIKEFYVVPEKRFSHFDFLYAKHLERLVNKKVINIFKDNK